MSLVVDACCVVAALLDSGPDGEWAERLIEVEDLAAPHLMPVEVANILRRGELGGDISSDAAALAHTDLSSMRIALFPYEPFADRIWALRTNLTACDAWYVALAESIGAPLATLDKKLGRASGPKCKFRLP